MKDHWGLLMGYKIARRSEMDNQRNSRGQDLINGLSNGPDWFCRSLASGVNAFRNIGRNLEGARYSLYQENTR